MSISDGRQIADKGGKPCAVFDVAINSEFFHKLNPYNGVIMSTIIEAIGDKHALALNENEFHILKNIKFKGKIEPMNIEQRPAKVENPKRLLISEIDYNSTDIAEIPKPKILLPDFNLLKIDIPKKYYASEIDLKNVLTKDEICLHLSEDRVQLTTTGKVEYQLEYHFPIPVSVGRCSAEFDKDNQVLTIIAPLESSKGN